MQRRTFAASLGAALGGLLPLAPARAAPVEGQDFTALKTPVQLPATGKVEVADFFWYGCPHCYAFEPQLEAWVARLPADVHFRRVAYGFDEPLRELHQQIYFTWEVLDVVEKMHRRTFDRFHQEHKPINSLGELLGFAGQNGLDMIKVKQAWNGFAVQTRLTQARQFCDDYDVDYVPQIGVQGRFVTAPALTGTGPKTLAVADALIERVRRNG